MRKFSHVAAIYDIHGNLPALEAVLSDIERVGPDLIVVGSDVASGPMPAETLDRLTALGDNKQRPLCPGQRRQGIHRGLRRRRAVRRRSGGPGEAFGRLGRLQDRLASPGPLGVLFGAGRRRG